MGDQPGVRRPLAAHTHRNTGGLGGLNGHFNGREHCRLHRIVQPRHRLIATIHRHHIAGQIIGTDGEEVHFLSQFRCGQRRSRGFYHNTHRHRVHILAGFDQLPQTLLNQLFSCQNLFLAGDQRQHQL